MRWRVLLLLFAVRVGLGVQFQTVASVGDDLVKAFGLGYGQVGTLIGLFMLPGLFLALPAGFAGRRLPDGALAGLGLGALAVGGAVSGLGADDWTIAAGRVLAGGGFLFANVYLAKMVAEWFAGRELATAMSVLVASWPCGIALGQVGHEWLSATMGWRWAFYAASAYCALAALAVAVVYRPPPEAETRRAAASAGLSRDELVLASLAGLAWGIFNAGYVVYLGFAPLALQARGEAAFDAAAIVSLGSWVMIGSGILCGQIADRWRRSDIVLTVGMLGAVAALSLLFVDGAGLVASLLFGLIGMAPAGVIMALSGEAVRPEARALGMGVFFTVYYAVMTASPPLAGALVDVSGRPGAPILFAMALFAAVIPIALLFRLRKAGGVPA